MNSDGNMATQSEKSQRHNGVYKNKYTKRLFLEGYPSNSKPLLFMRRQTGRSGMVGTFFFVYVQSTA